MGETWSRRRASPIIHEKDLRRARLMLAQSDMTMIQIARRLEVTEDAISKLNREENIRVFSSRKSQ